MKYILTLFIGVLFSTQLYAYSYAAAGKEPTIDAKEAIINAINNNDYKSAQEIFNKYTDNYKYLNKEFNNALYEELKKAIEAKNKEHIIKWLNISIASEIQRRLDGGFKNIKNFNIAKVMLAKANKFYKILSPSLNKEKDKQLKHAIEECVKAIGNPGLFGVGAKPFDSKSYQENHQIALKIIQSL